MYNLAGFEDERERKERLDEGDEFSEEYGLDDEEFDETGEPEDED